MYFDVQIAHVKRSEYRGPFRAIYRIDHLFCIILSSIRGKPPLLMNRYDKFIDFRSIFYHFKFETIYPQELGACRDNARKGAEPTTPFFAAKVPTALLPPTFPYFTICSRTLCNSSLLYSQNHNPTTHTTTSNTLPLIFHNHHYHPNPGS